MAFHRPYMTNKGYVMEYHPDHPRADKKGYVFAHIVAYEKHTGTRVPEGFVVHHINGLKTDNSPQNLALLTREEHTILHHIGQKRSKETKAKISVWAKARLSDPTNHPRFLPLDIEAIKSDRASGLSVAEICKKYGISKYTYYTRIRGYRRKKMNSIILLGRATSSIELKQTQAGKSVASFSLAVKRPFTKDTTDFHTVCAWDKQAELLSKYVKKGDQICIRGYLTTRTWTDNQGNKRYATEVVADEVSFVNAKESSTEAKSEPSTTYVPTAYGGNNAPQFEEIPDDGTLPF